MTCALAINLFLQKFTLVQLKSVVSLNYATAKLSTRTMKKP